VPPPSAPPSLPPLEEQPVIAIATAARAPIQAIRRFFMGILLVVVGAGIVMGSAISVSWADFCTESYCYGSHNGKEI
jgi:hypothetical protein